ncbi:TPA: hypothetical protein N0F65_003698 [Lagenidium giganteum]|uniref:Uncharacterized protein n=1 Tax=Lagenidium giganteum TaxID=4803 RepID=A0AAV2YXQ3_9STRA|nr:TPA: hypothetical protein N0F65_003698 [Lagenidium giganteum]
MRPRTKSITCTREYFGHSRRMVDVEKDEDDWMAIALAGAPGPKQNCRRSAHRSDSLDSLSSMDMEDDDDDDDSDDEMQVERTRTCSHDRRISFDDAVNVVTIPSRDSFDEEDKRRMWYSNEEFHRMRQFE